VVKLSLALLVVTVLLLHVSEQLLILDVHFSQLDSLKPDTQLLELLMELSFDFLSDDIALLEDLIDLLVGNGGSDDGRSLRNDILISCRGW